jgi:hypothetical protein
VTGGTAGKVFFLSMNLCRGGKLEDEFVQNVVEIALNVNVVVPLM